PVGASNRTQGSDHRGNWVDGGIRPERNRVAEFEVHVRHRFGCVVIEQLRLVVVRGTPRHVSFSRRAPDDVVTERRTPDDVVAGVARAPDDVVAVTAAPHPVVPVLTAAVAPPPDVLA